MTLAQCTSPEPEVGKVVLTRYRVTRHINDGGMSRVFEGIDEQLGRRVALKFIKKDTVPDARALARMDQEGRILSSLVSEHLPVVFELSTTAPEPLIVMEFVDGVTLRQLLLDESPLSVPRALRIAIQVTRALEKAHQAGVVHRDLKPENIILSRYSDGGELAKVVDFGAARVERPDDGLTTTGNVIGTPRYMSPEQARGNRVDARSDLYALGAILYEMLTGRFAHEGEHYNQIIYQILTQPVPPIRTLRPVQPELELVLEKTLERDLSQRFQSAGQLLSALLKTTDRPNPTSTELSRGPAGALVTQDDAKQLSGVQLTGLTRSRFRVAVALALLVGTLTGAVAVSWWEEIAHEHKVSPLSSRAVAPETSSSGGEAPMPAILSEKPSTVEAHVGGVVEVPPVNSAASKTTRPVEVAADSKQIKPVRKQRSSSRSASAVGPSRRSKDEPISSPASKARDVKPSADAPMEANPYD